MKKSHANLSFLIALFLFPVCSLAVDSDAGEMRARMEALEKKVAEMRGLEQELRELRALLDKQEMAAASRAEVEELKREVADTRARQDEWKSYDSAVHLAGYGSVGYTDNDPEDGRFDLVAFNPIFHYQYRDLVLLEAELELSVEEDGATELNLEYMTIDLLLHDNAALVAGKFLSPLGQFRQNLHPGWINRMASAPPGFGHGGAAPIAEVGLQARGAFELPFGESALLNYAVYVGNGPELEVGGHGAGHDAAEEEEEEEEEDEEAEIEGVETEGFTRDIDDNKVFGGRIGIVPIPNIELGGSIAMGDVALEGPGEGDRDYDVYGVDFSARWRGARFLAEWIKTEVGSEVTSIAPDAQEWEAWYTQLSYRFLPTKFEAVLRYADATSSHVSQEQEQIAIGANWWFNSHTVAKLGYEFNDGATGNPRNENRLMLQISYGF